MSAAATQCLCYGRRREYSRLLLEYPFGGMKFGTVSLYALCLYFQVHHFIRDYLSCLEPRRLRTHCVDAT